MADEPNAPPPEPLALDEPVVAAEVANPYIIPVSEVSKLEGFRVDPSLAREGTPLTGDEHPKGKVTVRTRYPVDRFEADGVTITAAGVKVSGSDLPDLVRQARSAGTDLESV